MSLNQHQRMVQRKLQAGQRVNGRIRKILADISELENMAISSNSNISDMPANPNRNIHRMEDMVVQICDMKMSAEKELKRLLNIKAELQSYIYQVPDPTGQTILERRYFDGQTWTDIAHETGYSVRSVQRLHDRSIDQIRIA